MFRSVVAVALMLSAAVPAAQAQFFGPLAGAPTWIHGQRYQVQIRAWGWEERTFASPYEARQFAGVLRSQGRVVYVQQHGGLTLVRFQAPAWRTYEVVGSHQRAHQLERYLESRGYNARVVHY